MTVEESISHFRYYAYLEFDLNSTDVALVKLEKSEVANRTEWSRNFEGPTRIFLFDKILIASTSKNLLLRNKLLIETSKEKKGNVILANFTLINLNYKFILEMGRKTNPSKNLNNKKVRSPDDDGNVEKRYRSDDSLYVTTASEDEAGGQSTSESLLAPREIEQLSEIINRANLNDHQVNDEANAVDDGDEFYLGPADPQPNHLLQPLDDSNDLNRRMEEVIEENRRLQQIISSQSQRYSTVQQQANRTGAIRKTFSVNALPGSSASFKNNDVTFGVSILALIVDKPTELVSFKAPRRPGSPYARPSASNESIFVAHGNANMNRNNDRRPNLILNNIEGTSDVVIRHGNYPARVIQDEEFKEIEKTLNRMCLQAERQKKIDLNIASIRHKQGAIIVICNNSITREWIMRIVPITLRLEALDRMDANLRSAYNFWVPMDGTSFEEACQVIRPQGFHSQEWTLLKTYLENRNGGQKFLMLGDDDLDRRCAVNGVIKIQFRFCKIQATVQRLTPFDFNHELNTPGKPIKHISNNYLTLLIFKKTMLVSLLISLEQWKKLNESYLELKTRIVTTALVIRTTWARISKREIDFSSHLEISCNEILFDNLKFKNKTLSREKYLSLVIFSDEIFLNNLKCKDKTLSRFWSVNLKLMYLVFNMEVKRLFQIENYFTNKRKRTEMFPLSSEQLYYEPFLTKLKKSEINKRLSTKTKPHSNLSFGWNKLMNSAKNLLPSYSAFVISTTKHATPASFCHNYSIFNSNTETLTQSHLILNLFNEQFSKHNLVNHSYIKRRIIIQIRTMSIEGEAENDHG